VSKIKVFIVDDSTLVRRMVAHELERDPDIEIIGTAGDGKSGLTKILQLRPDVVVLDVEMPELDGIGLLRELRKHHPTTRVLMFSSLTERGAAVTVEALSLGASDYIAKPSKDGQSAQAVHEELRIKVHALGTSGRSRPPRKRRDAGERIDVVAPPPVTSVPVRVARRTPAASTVDILAIGVSTGGPNALNVVLSALPASFPVPIVIVQHMPPEFTRQLAQRLDGRCQVSIVEAEDGMPVVPGQAYIAPGNFHMEVKGRVGDMKIALHQGPLENSCRPAVDVLFRSLVPQYGSHILSVVLTGMGQDGLRGSECIHQAGGRVIAQDEATSVVWGMPGQVAQHGLADAVLPLEEISPHIMNLVGNRGASERTNHHA
jgi:two-component system, chemotaxis family, protein-glutamate methylesterase/glutaminase